MAEPVVVTTPLRVAAVGDLHATKGSEGKLAPVLEAVNRLADVLLLAGDLTDYGTADEARVLARELSGVRVPILAVLGNHDHESGTPEAVVEVLSEARVRVLSGDSVTIGDTGFVGAKGFAGGFGRHTLGAWGEPAMKRFVQEALDQAMMLESALARLRTRHRVALLHYSPIEETVRGEPEPIFPFLGCSRLEEPLVRYPVDVVFHGHAHRGAVQGRTTNGTPVFNVALPLLRETQRDGPYLRVFTLGGTGERDAGSDAP
jgi:Icc-related predicted phosphoesterase